MFITSSVATNVPFLLRKQAALKMSAIMRKYEIGVLEESDESPLSPSFYDWSSDFYPVLKKRVCDVLKDKGLDRRGGGGGIHVKAVCLLVIFWSSLSGMCLTSGYLIPLLCCVIMGLAASFIGTCIQHDGSHGAFSNHLWLNKAAGWTLDMIGASAFTWEVQHMLGHHPYTNLLDVAGFGGTQDGDGVGDDIEVRRLYPVLLCCSTSPPHPHIIHRFAHKPSLRSPTAL